MNSLLKWGAIIVVLYLLYRWWVNSQTAAPVNTVNNSPSVYGGGILTTQPRNTATYQPYSTQPPASTVVGNSQPGFIGGLINTLRPISSVPTGVGTSNAISAGIFTYTPPTSDTVQGMGLIARGGPISAGVQY